jgi:hypothetical protein
MMSRSIELLLGKMTGVRLGVGTATVRNRSFLYIARGSEYAESS